MIKNTASQKIGAQMVTAADGTAFTSAVTVSVTGDAGAQATGSVGSGACVHEGNGYHTYAPAQAETNYDLIAFTFTGTGAIPTTVQVFTVAGDAFTRLGAPAGASVSADVAAVKVDTAAVKVQTDKFVFTVANQVDSNVLDWKSATAPAMTGDAFARLGAPAGASVSVDVAAIKTQTAAIEVDTAEIGAAGAGLTAINLPNQTMDIIGTLTGNITGNLSGSVGSVTGAVGSVTGAVGSVTGAVGSVTAGVTLANDAITAAKLAADAGTELAAAVLAAAAVAPIDANLQKVNDVALVGDGAATPWGPA